jgi:signal peptidase I
MIESTLKTRGNDSVVIVDIIKTDNNPISDYCVKYDNYFVIGDNYCNSLDSRSFGCVNFKSIKAKAKIIYFSTNKGISYSNLIHEIRWNRIGKKIL